MADTRHRGSEPRGRAVQAGTARAEDRDAAIDKASPSQQGHGRGHKAQQAQPHRPGRPSGGNIRNPLDD